MLAFYGNTNEARFREYSKCKSFALSLLVTALCMYSFGIGVYECYLGSVSVRLVSEYHGYSAEIGNSTISINSFPRDIYSDTKTNAALMIFCGSTGIIMVLLSLWMLCYTKKFMIFLVCLIVANISVIVIPFCYATFLTWKYNSMSSNDKIIWNNVDTGFIDNLKHSQDLLIATVVPGVVWFIALVGAFKTRLVYIMD
jgi:hypothetical protein